ncbi:putative endoglucanase type K [Hypsibius exemplaris]|uniref:Cellulase n=1 Tax=Hypsibius exemplaris TaxID=2072580 RepID=A0A1W0X6X5_HYPEX|nr:putative endoglucanase type K [Hypsibius exemplaris]
MSHRQWAIFPKLLRRLSPCSIIFLVLLQQLRPSYGQVNWNGNNWALGCQFEGNNLTQDQSTSAQCGGQCAGTPRCTHFTHQNGTCFMKQGTISRSDAVPSPDPNSVCGVNGIPEDVPTTFSPKTSVKVTELQTASTTRYWDCCKPSCGWPEKAVVTNPVQTCLRDGTTKLTDSNAKSGCAHDGPGEAFTCTNTVPWVINDRLAYGFAAAKIVGLDEGDWCCACYKLDFADGPAVGKSMVVQVTNTGYSNSSNFNLQIPGGGVGSENGCGRQWAVNTSSWGQVYGGLDSRDKCEVLPVVLRKGCYFRFDWLEGANNPSVHFAKVPCPTELEEISQCRRTEFGGKMSVNSTVVVQPATPETLGRTNRIAVIAGVTVSVGILLLVIVASLLVRRRWNAHRKMEKRHSAALALQHSYEIRRSSKPNFLCSHPVVAQYADLLDVPPENLDISETILGKGEFGIVYKAVAHQLPTVRKLDVVVAVKVLLDDSDLHKANLFAEEFRVMLKAGRHVNIVNILGIVQHGKPLLVLEYCEFGSLRSFVRNHRPGRSTSAGDEHRLPESGDDQVPLTALPLPVLSTIDLVRFSHQIASGMEYLSSRSIIHRDLAARNVLLAQNKIIKISDFGLAKHGAESYTASNHFVALPILWMPPEAIITRGFSQKSDVWSMGVTLWEIFSYGDVPFASLNVVKFSAIVFAEWLMAGNQMPPPDGTPHPISQIMKECWKLPAEERPTFTQIWKMLDDFLAQMSDTSDHGRYLSFFEEDDPTPVECKLIELSQEILELPDEETSCERDETAGTQSFVWKE